MSIKIAIALGARKIWKIHFRNVSAPLPHFVETFMDNGYYDMWKIMKALLNRANAEAKS